MTKYENSFLDRKLWLLNGKIQKESNFKDILVRKKMSLETVHINHMIQGNVVCTVSCSLHFILLFSVSLYLKFLCSTLFDLNTLRPGRNTDVSKIK